MGLDVPLISGKLAIAELGSVIAFVFRSLRRRWSRKKKKKPIRATPKITPTAIPALDPAVKVEEPGRDVGLVVGVKSDVEEEDEIVDTKELPVPDVSLDVVGVTVELDVPAVLTGMV